MPAPARAALAGLAYAIAVFLVGSAAGVIRILVLEPRFGAVIATAIELPMMVAMAWLICLSLANRCAVSPRVGDRMLMGASAFLVLVGAELGLAALLGRIVDYRDPATLLGLAGQLTLLLFPMLQARFFARRVRALP
jgi:hypothetical protein